ncbi:MAG TPA: helix-turn-helix domain-containing protein [Fimbriimonas sp.]|nr:helix-turn-helix domain-containing protein [Fimbriimonas sp.]
MDSDTVWRALASPHRRTLLDLLRSGPKTTGELARELPALSRFAVMQHLGVLEEAKLVLYRKEGRKRMNYANPIPLREIYERWVSGPASSAAETDLHLRRYAETKHKETKPLSETEFRLVKIETELRIKAPRERVYAAFFEEIDNWWPHRYKPDSRCSAEEKPGGFVYEHFVNGGGAITGTVVYVDRPGKFAATGPSSLLRGLSSYNVHTLEDDGEGGTVLKRSMELWGNVPEEMETMFREGTRQFMDSSLVGYLEQGIKYGQVRA